MRVNSTTKQDLDRQTFIEIAKEFGVINAEVTLMENLTLDRLMDCFAKNRTYVKGLYVINKIDKVANNPEVSYLDHLRGGQTIKISADKDIGLEELREELWERLGLTRVYLRRTGQATDFEDALIMLEGDTLGDVMKKIGNDFAQGVKEVKIWGNGSKFEGQKVSLTTLVQDGMEVMFVR